MSDGPEPVDSLNVVERPRARYTVSFSCGSLQQTVHGNQVITTSSLFLRDLYTIFVLLSVVFLFVWCRADTGVSLRCVTYPSSVSGLSIG